MEQGDGEEADRLDEVRESALATLAAVSACLEADEEPSSLLGSVAGAIAGGLGAGRVAFWRLRRRGALALEPEPFGFETDSAIHGFRIELGPGREGAIGKVVYGDGLQLAHGTMPELDALWREAGLLAVSSSIAAPWLAGERRLGVVVAYDSARGFTLQDVWLLRLAGMAAGLVWRNRQAEEELGHTSVRLEEAVTVRRHLLNNIAAGGDEARRRFASALHDDSLQLLTAAEMQLARIRGDARNGQEAIRLEQLDGTLHKVEDSLRRLLNTVSPEPLPASTNFHVAVGERLESMRLQLGIEAHTDIRVPDELPATVHSTLVKNVGEALTNVEKHASATHVVLTAEIVDGGVRVKVKDDGRGFVVGESVRTPGHIGLVAMRERTQLAGGWCEIQSDPGAGATVEFWVPLNL